MNRIVSFFILWGAIICIQKIYTKKITNCYSFNTYKDLQARKPCDEVPVLGISGICPIESTVENGTYPLISKVHVAIRSDADRNSMTYKLYEWLQSEEAKKTIMDCGFLTK
jgi:phosphate transport system substrate-binding protein